MGFAYPPATIPRKRFSASSGAMVVAQSFYKTNFPPVLAQV
jgi:hypothetical protein